MNIKHSPIIFTVIIITLFSCCQSQLDTDYFSNQAKQNQKFITLQIGETFTLTDFNIIEPTISYRNEYTTTYRIRYDYFWWHVTVNNKDFKVISIRSFK